MRGIDEQRSQPYFDDLGIARLQPFGNSVIVKGALKERKKRQEKKRKEKPGTMVKIDGL
jgi:hypothetical protein